MPLFRPSSQQRSVPPWAVYLEVLLSILIWALQCFFCCGLLVTYPVRVELTDEVKEIMSQNNAQ